MSKRILVITVHGIRTFGKWQERLETLTRFGWNKEGRLDFIHYRYGYFSALAFLIPPLRNLVVRRFSNELLRVLATTPPDTKICLFGHSFGTHIIAWGLYRVREKIEGRIETLVLAGSVLRSSFPIGMLSGCVRRTINDCGVHDSVLLLSQFVVLFTGAAGRLGMHGFEGDQLINRYFVFAHSGYFERNGNLYDGFLDQYWKPLILSEDPPVRHDCRQVTTVGGVELFLANNIEPIKLFFWLSPPIALVMILASLYFSSQSNLKLATARSISSASRDLIDRSPSNFSRAALLAAEAVSRAHTLETDKVARSFLRSRSPRPLLEIPGAYLLGATQDEVLVAHDDDKICLYAVPSGRPVWCRKINSRPAYGRYASASISTQLSLVAVRYESEKAYMTEIISLRDGEREYITEDRFLFCGPYEILYSDRKTTVTSGTHTKVHENPFPLGWYQCANEDALVAISKDGEIAVLSPSAGKWRPLMLGKDSGSTYSSTLERAWTAAAFTDVDGRRLFVTRENYYEMVAYDLDSGLVVWSYRTKHGIGSLNLVAGKVVVSSSENVSIHDPKDGALMQTIERVKAVADDRDAFDAMAISTGRFSDERILHAVISKNDRVALVSELGSNLVLASLPHDRRIQSLRLGRSGRWVAVEAPDSVYIWKAESLTNGNNMNTTLPERPVLSIDDRALIAVDGTKIVRWDLVNGGGKRVVYEDLGEVYWRMWIEPTSADSITILSATVANSIQVDRAANVAPTVLRHEDVKIATCHGPLFLAYPKLMSDSRHAVFGQRDCSGVIDLRSMHVIALDIDGDFVVDPARPRVLSLRGGVLLEHSLSGGQSTIWEAPREGCRLLAADRSAVFIACANNPFVNTKDPWDLFRIPLDRRGRIIRKSDMPRIESVTTDVNGKLVALHGREETLIADAVTLDSFVRIPKQVARGWFINGDKFFMGEVESSVPVFEVFSTASGDRVAAIGGDRVITVTHDSKGIVAMDSLGDFQIEPLDASSLVRSLCLLANRNLSIAEWEEYFPGETFRPVCDQSGGPIDQWSVKWRKGGR